MTGLATLAMPVAARPQAPQRAAISVERIDLARALRQFSKQTGRQVAAPAHLLRARKATAVDGRTSPEAALSRLLEGTGLSFRTVDGGFVIAAPVPVVAPRAETLDPHVVPAPMSDVVVVGTRLDSGEAVNIRRRALQSVNILTDDDIRRFPDTSLADVARRVPGVQLSVRSGGGIVTVRGLSQVEERLNGRNLSSTTFRGFDIAALPADIVSGMDVYKTPSASQIEGGIGGVIDFHTRRPFDGPARTGMLTVKSAHGNLDDRIRPYVSGHVGARADVGAGEIGLLVGGSHQGHDIGGDIFRVETNAGQATPQGDVVDAPAEATKRYLRGTKTLTTGYAAAQWRPSDAVELTADLLVNRSDLDFANVSLTAGLADGAITRTFAGDRDGDPVRRATWANVPLTSATNHGIGHFDARQYGLNARVIQGALTILVDAALSRTGFHYGTAELSLRTTASLLSYDKTGGIPYFTVAGVDPERPASWRPASYDDVRVANDNEEAAGRVDAIYTGTGPIRTVKVGLRLTQRRVTQRLAVASAYAADGASFSVPVGPSGSRLFSDRYPQPIWNAPAPGSLVPGRVERTRASFDLAPIVTRLDYDGAETIANAYAEAGFDLMLGAIPVQGDVGIRYAETRVAMQRQDGSGATPVRYGHWLPSLNLRAELASATYLRLGWSRQITRPSFAQLAPTTTIDFVNAVGEAGNPVLRPLAATQYDVVLDYYFGRRGNAYLAGFYKSVSGFIRMQALPEEIQGRTLLINRPINADDGWIGGIEAGYVYRLTFLPGAWAGLGVQASYTRVASFRVDNGAGYRVPLEQLSRDNHALSATYDRDGVTADLTWVWRSRIVELSRGDVAGRPLYRDPYGQLDANLSVALTPRFNAVAGVVNALRRRSAEYFGDVRRLHQVFVESRRFLVGVTYRTGGP